MKRFNVDLKGDVKKFENLAINAKDSIELAMLDIGLMVQNQAKLNAPFAKGTLRRSISTDFSKIKKGIVIVWSPVAYARRREYENYKNPDKKHYLERAYKENKAKIENIIEKALNIKLK